MPKNAGDNLQDAANIYKERNKIYGDNYKVVGEVMKQLFPNGVELKTAQDFNRWHLLELLVVKLTRYCNNWKEGGHEDSIVDLGVYAFMVQEVDQLGLEGDDNSFASAH